MSDVCLQIDLCQGHSWSPIYCRSCLSGILQKSRMSNPSMASMSPFIPRSTPPPPIRIQLQDSLAEHFKSNFLTPSERAIQEKDVSFLKENINHEMAILQTELESAKLNLSSYIKRIGSKLQELRNHRDAVKKETSLNSLANHGHL